MNILTDNLSNKIEIGFNLSQLKRTVPQIKKTWGLGNSWWLIIAKSTSSFPPEKQSSVSAEFSLPKSSTLVSGQYNFSIRF
jgi:hypothetical protein